MNPRYQDFLNDLHADKLLEEVVSDSQRIADPDEAVKVFGDEFVMVAHASEELSLGCAAEADMRPEASSAVEIRESRPQDIEALHRFLDLHDKLPSADAAQCAPPEPAGEAAKEFALQGLGRESAVIRHQLKKRAVDEVNGLHMVDHVLCAAEREQRKVVSHPHDGLHVKQALHDFLQALATDDVSAISIAEAKFIEETQKWFWELLEKDSRLTVADLRRYCETTQPALSSRALTALARFYRISPFSYSVREKFELVMTRLYSRETGGDKRKTLFARDLIVQQIGGLYAEWASLQTYSEDGSFEVTDAAGRLGMLMSEAEIAETFEELVADDFFTRLRSFKESLHEEFFSPVVTAAAIECNVLVGNRFIELLEKERKRDTIEALGERFAEVCGENVSDMTGKTIDLAEKMCGGRRRAVRTVQERRVVPVKRKGALMKRIKSMFSVGPWLFVTVAIIALSSVAIYYGAQRMIFDDSSSVNVKRVNLENSVLKDYVHGATVSGETLVGIVTPAWDSLEDNQKTEAVRMLLEAGAGKGFKFVRLKDPIGRTVASGTPEKIDLVR